MEIREFLKTLTTDPRARELMKGMAEPKDGKEAVRQYAEIAKKLGINAPKRGLEAFLKLREEIQKKRTEQAGEAVKEALSESSLSSVAGGGDSCDSTFEPHEWCWFSDSCSVVINGYSGDKVQENTGKEARETNDPSQGLDDWEVIDVFDVTVDHGYDCIDNANSGGSSGSDDDYCEVVFDK